MSVPNGLSSLASQTVGFLKRISGFPVSIAPGKSLSFSYIGKKVTEIVSS